MAIIIPNLRLILGNAKATPGEKRLALRLESLLDDDWFCYYDIPVGKKPLYPDFILVHPRCGLLFLEVKDWKRETIKSINHDRVELETDSGLTATANPVKQARDYARDTVKMLERDPHLRQKQGKHKGKLICPWGYGVVLTNITRKQIQSPVPDDLSARVLRDHLLICQDEMLEGTDPNAFEERLRGMFEYRFEPLCESKIDRIRGRLYPEIRIDNFELFPQQKAPGQVFVPDVVKVMDIHQEQLARGLGDGHRVIHGVAGSGKTLILEFRAEVLAKLLNKPILVLCFNITLAAKLRRHMRSKGIDDKVHVHHFHGWCKEQLETYNVDVAEGDKPHYELQVDSVIAGVQKGQIPLQQYGALLIDEGQDFEEDWLRLVVWMVDRNTNSLLLVYDDAAAIFRRSGLGFTLSSVGVQARGRTTILDRNYRNTRQILTFAYEFAKELFQGKSSSVPLIEPQAAGADGPMPIFKQLGSFEEEAGFAADCVLKWHADGVPWRDVAIIYAANWMGEAVAERFRQRDILFQLLSEKKKKKQKKQYDPEANRVVLLTRHSSKGLEFSRVILVGLGKLPTKPEEIADESRLLYVAMTRARECLLMTASGTNVYTQKIESICL